MLVSSQSKAGSLKEDDGGHMEKDFIFEESGNHIFRVDLYDAASDGGVLTFSSYMVLEIFIRFC